MRSEERSKRFASDLEVMRALAEQSSILEFESRGDPPEEYKVALSGKGIARGSGYGGEVEYAETHEFQIRLSYLYPERAPDVRFLTQIFHPNVSSTGYVRLEECGLEWSADMTLDVICERLWDIVRGAYLEMENAANYSAKGWYAEQSDVTLPVDDRPLRDRAAPSSGNVVHYERGPTGGKPSSDEVFYIGDDTPSPTPPPRPPRKPSGDDDVFYIGDE